MSDSGGRVLYGSYGSYGIFGICTLTLDTALCTATSHLNK